MYRDEGYGQNWQPESAANARRIDPYTRSCAVLGSLFAIGFVLIVIVVLSLIPIYISHQNNSNTNAKKTIQVARVYINDYPLVFPSSKSTSFSSLPFLQLDHRLALEAALTSLIQQESSLQGSIVETNLPSRRTMMINATLIVQITNNRTCALTSCLNLFQSQINQVLTKTNDSSVVVPYQEKNSTEIRWISYQLPSYIQSSVSSVAVDPTAVASQLEKLLLLDHARQQLWKESFSQTTVFING